MQEILNDHERRLTIVEASVRQLVPKVEVMEMIAPLHSQMNSMQSTVERFMEGTEHQIQMITKELGEGMRRLGDINEENMRTAARQVEEKHQAELVQARKEASLKDEQLKELRVQAEARRLPNRIKNDWAPLLGVIIVGWTVANYAGTTLTWLIKTFAP